MIQPLVCGLDGLNQEVQTQRDGCPGKEVLDNAVDNNFGQVSDLQKQLNEVHTVFFHLIVVSLGYYCDHRCHLNLICQILMQLLNTTY